MSSFEKRLLFTLFLSAIAGASFLVAQGTAMPRGDAPVRIEARTELFAFGGIHIATNRTSVDTDSGHYAIVADTETRGIWSVFVNLRTHSEVQGSIVLDHLRPKTYRGEVHRNGVDAYARIDYGDDGKVTGQANPPGQLIKPDRAATGRTVDQLTAFFAVERQVARGRSCADDIPVFDARHLYTLHFRDAGLAPPTESGDARFAGPIRICQMERQAIAGFPDGEGHTEGVYEATLYYALLSGDEMAIPVHMELQTEFGPVSAHLVNLLVNGAEWHSPE